MDQAQIESLSQRFLALLNLPRQPAQKPRRPFAVGIIRIPGAGGTTVSRKLAQRLSGAVHIQANSARFLLKEAGLPWGNNVRDLLRSVIRALLLLGYGVIVDGNALEQKDRENLDSVVEEINAPIFYVRVNTDPANAEKRERAKYDDSEWISSFDDFRVNTTEKMAQNIRDRAQVSAAVSSNSIQHLIGEIDNNGSLDQLDSQVEEIAGKIKAALS